MHQITIVPAEAVISANGSLLAVAVCAACAIGFYVWHFTRPTGGLGGQFASRKKR